MGRQVRRKATGVALFSLFSLYLYWFFTSCICSHCLTTLELPRSENTIANPRDERVAKTHHCRSGNEADSTKDQTVGPRPQVSAGISMLAEGSFSQGGASPPRPKRGRV